MSQIEYDPVDAQIMHLCRLGILRELTAEEKLELAQLQAADQAQLQPHEVPQ